jgi:tetratricopeptide (TPR) repeat protein
MKSKLSRLERLKTRIAVTGPVCILAAVSALLFSPRLQAAEGAAGLSATGKVEEAVSPELRNYLQLQEQLRATQLAVDRNRKESTETALQTAEALASGMKATSETLANRMKVLEEALGAQRARELEVMQGTNRTMLVVAGTFACFGFLALFLMGYFQWRTVSRLAELSAILPPAGLALPNQRPRAALVAGESSVVAALPNEDQKSDLLQTIGQLEKRVRELESGIATHGANGGRENGDTPDSAAGDKNNEIASEGTNRIAVLLGKGQSLLNVEKPEEALACFDEALELDPRHAEALVKKGAALERLRKLNEAIECYDRAIEADSAMTIAYLYKGGLCNRMERFNEALQCYEQALRTQEKRAA